MFKQFRQFFVYIPFLTYLSKTSVSADSCRQNINETSTHYSTNTISFNPIDGLQNTNQFKKLSVQVEDHMKCVLIRLKPNMKK